MLTAYSFRTYSNIIPTVHSNVHFGRAMDKNKSLADGDSFDASFSVDDPSSQVGVFKPIDVNNEEVDRTYEVDDEKKNTLISDGSGEPFIHFLSDQETWYQEDNPDGSFIIQTIDSPAAVNSLDTAVNDGHTKLKQKQTLSVKRQNDKENVVEVLPSPWLTQKSTSQDQPTSCFKKKNTRKDPIVECISDLTQILTDGLKKEAEKKEHDIKEREKKEAGKRDLERKEAEKKEDEENKIKFLIPVEDEMFGKTVAMTLSKISDPAVKLWKQGLIMADVYRPNKLPD